MQPIFFTLSKKLPVMIIPDSQASMDGHPILTYTYNIYYDNHHADAKLLVDKESKLHLEKKNDPDYMGFITFEVPGKLFIYTSDGNGELSSEEVQEIIEIINHYRDTPSIWEI